MTVFPSTLIISDSVSKTEKQISRFCQNLKNLFNPNNPDILTIGRLSWTINDIRQLKKFFSQKPLSHRNKIALIFSADQLAAPAQNALLKVLEEPGPNHFLLLSTDKPQALLPTILSRCHQVYLSSKTILAGSAIPQSLNLHQNLVTADRLTADKDAVLPLLKKELNFQQQNLVKKPSSATAKKISRLIHSLQMVDHNVDPRSALDYYILSS